MSAFGAAFPNSKKIYVEGARGAPRFVRAASQVHDVARRFFGDELLPAHAVAGFEIQRQPPRIQPHDGIRVEAEEPEGKRPAGTLMALAQYAILVVGLVMVLIGVLVMVANSHVT